MLRFANRLFRSQAVAEALQGIVVAGKLKADSGLVLEGHRIRCTMTRMDAFDKLLQNRQESIFQAGGRNLVKISHRSDVTGFSVHDRLREMILCEDSPNRDAVTSSHRAEFLWQLFEHLVLGGRFNQYEDNAAIYKTITKLIYKQLISVKRNSAKSLTIRSVVFKVKSADFHGTPLFPTESINNFCYIIADDVTKVCHMIYHAMRR
eukprot:jgi/Ulvmu1/5893/UM026_0014.1